MIIDATEQLLSEKSFESITMDDIAEKSDFAKASIYQYFKNKDDLMSEVFSKVLETQCRLIKEKCLSQSDSLQALRNYIRLELDYISLNPWISKVTAAIPSIHFQADHHLVDLYAQKKDLIAAIIHQGQTEGTFIPSDRIVTANMILAVSAGFASYLLTHTQPDSQEPVIDMLISIIIKGMTEGV
jgi:AcrR family transcriptional regulator